MFGFQANLPVSDSERLWIDQGFDRLSRVLGHDRMLRAEVVLPSPEHFPDPYNRTEEDAEKMFRRICKYMRVDRNTIDLEVFPDEAAELSRVVPYWSSESGGCAGLYTRDDDSSRMVVGLKATQLNDPLALVATLAHELGHVILLGGELISRDVPDMEPLTDLLTVFLGFGVFNANTAARFEQHDDGNKQGWSMQRLGYLSEEMYGYALAKFALERGEQRPEWADHLATNVKAYYKRSRAWLTANKGKAYEPPPPIG